ncbi:hypothetical protein [Burkholderia sp. MSMB617WGS]|uniref:hypothetical protein n=1 Tax=Burkholderia sp. MSMB617WGS TaxID=1637831 RepID=UPI000AEE9FB0|nr:hypothetical protein [Burkholderia sp. MSMB617WGS]
MSIRQTHIWIVGFVFAFMLAMSGPLTYTVQTSVSVDKKMNPAPEETAAFHAKSAETPSVSDVDRTHIHRRIDPARPPADRLDELPMHLASIGDDEPLPSGPLPPGPLPDTSFSPFPFQLGVEASSHVGLPISAPPSPIQARIDTRTLDGTPSDAGRPRLSESVDTPPSFYADMVAQAMDEATHDAIVIVKPRWDATAPASTPAESRDASIDTNAPIFYADMLTASMYSSIAYERAPSAPRLWTRQAVDIAWTNLFARELPATSMQTAAAPYVASFDATLQAEPFDLAQWNEPDEAHADMPRFELDGQNDSAPPPAPTDALSSGAQSTKTDSTPDSNIEPAESTLVTHFESADEHVAAVCNRPRGFDAPPTDAQAIAFGSSGMEMLVTEQFARSARTAYDNARERDRDCPTAFVNPIALPQASNHVDSDEDSRRFTLLRRFASDLFPGAFATSDETRMH